MYAQFMGEHLKSEMFISWFKSIERMICDARHNIIKRPSKNNTNKNGIGISIL